MKKYLHHIEEHPLIPRSAFEHAVSAQKHLRRILEILPSLEVYEINRNADFGYDTVFVFKTEYENEVYFSKVYERSVTHLIHAFFQDLNCDDDANRQEHNPMTLEYMVAYCLVS